MAYDAWGGSWGSSWALTWTGEHTSTPPLPVVTTTQGGVRRSRFLRRGPRLPWDQSDEPEVVRVQDAPKPKRKRIKLPAEVIETVEDAIPVQAYVEVPMPRVIVPDIPVDFDDEDDDWLMMI